MRFFHHQFTPGLSEVGIKPATLPAVANSVACLTARPRLLRQQWMITTLVLHFEVTSICEEREL